LPLGLRFWFEPAQFDDRYESKRHLSPYCIIRGFTLSALIFPKVAGVETSLDGFAKIRAIEDVEDAPAESQDYLLADLRTLDDSQVNVALVRPPRMFLPRFPKIVPPPSDTGYCPSTNPPSGINGALTNVCVLNN
jgi:hypothetical protein